MGSPTAAPARPSAQAAAPAPAQTPPTVPAAPALAGLVAARWLYVDEARTHEVRAGLRPGAKPAFVIKGSSYQNERADEIVVEEHAIDAPWEAQLFQWRLECRLSLMGTRYWKHDATDPGWRALTTPQGLPQIDAREVAASPYRGRVVFHHFHHAKLKEDKLLVAIPQEGGARYLLALASFHFPNAADGEVRLLHAHLPAAPARSVVLREHLDLQERGFSKLVWGPDFLVAHGQEWSRETGQAYAQVLQRISEGSFGRPGQERAGVIDPPYTDFLHALTDPRLLALQARFLTPEEQNEALASGEAAIRRLIASKRPSASHEDQHKLTLVEASLVAREQLRPGQRARVDPEVSALVRRFSYYL